MARKQYYRIVGNGRDDENALRSRPGRFHDAGSGPTSYVAPSLDVAWKEVSAPFGAARANPAAFRAYLVELEDPRLLDLLDDSDSERLMVDPSPPEGRALADRARASGKDGIRYPSMRSQGDECVVLFLENLGHRVSMRPVPDDEWADFLKSLE